MKLKFVAAAAATAFFGATGPAAALPFEINFTDGTVASTNASPTGAAALLGFDFSDVTGGVRLDLSIENTTGDVNFGTGATEATLLGVFFDVTDVFLNSQNDLNVSTISLPSELPFFGLDRTIQGLNSGTFDIGICNNNQQNQGACPQGGNANDGLLATDPAITVSLLFETNSLASALAMSLMDGLADPNSGIDAGLRFQQVNGTGASSDKLLYTGSTVSTVPLPATLPLLLGALGVLGFGMSRKRSA